MSEELSIDDALSEDAGYFLEVMLQKIEIKELLKYEVKPGDGSLIAKAQRVLETGAKHIAEGRPSEEFLRFVAYSIIKTLTGEEPSLDSAFRLENRPQRPNEDPYSNPAILKYLEVMGKQFAEFDGSDLTPGQRQKALNAQQRKAIDAAYEAKFGITPQADKKRGTNEESIRKRKTSIKDTLAYLGNYAKEGK